MCGKNSFFLLFFFLSWHIISQVVFYHMTGIINLNQTETQIIYSFIYIYTCMQLAIFLEVLAITHGLLLSLFKIYRAQSQTSHFFLFKHTTKGTS